MPDYVKDAGSDDLFGGPGAPCLHWGEPRLRLYPIHTPAAVWASSAKFAEARHDLGPVAALAVKQRIKEAARWFGVADDAAAAARDAEAALAADEAEARRARALDPAVFKSAGAEWSRGAGAAPPEERKSAALEWIEIASARPEIAVPGPVAASARVAPTVPGRDAARGVAARAALAASLGWDKVASIMRNMADDCARLADDDHAGRDRLINVVDEVDRALARNVGERPFPLAETLFYDADTKDASAEFVTLRDGSVYALENVVRTKAAAVRECVGDQLASAVGAGLFWDAGRLLSGAAALSRDDTALFKMALAAQGARPDREARSRRALTFQELRRLASMAP